MIASASSGVRAHNFADFLDRGVAHLSFDALQIDYVFLRRREGYLPAACSFALRRGNCPATGCCAKSGAPDVIAICGPNMRPISGRTTNRPISRAVSERMPASMILNQ